MFKSFGASLVIAVVAFFGVKTSAFAQSCSSTTSCARYIVCPSGYTKEESTSGAYCKKVLPASTATPTCKQGKNAVFNWKWDASKGGCTHGNSTTVTTDNVDCPTGYDFDSGSKKCEKDAQTLYAEPNLSTSSSNGGSVDSCSSPSACGQTVDCPSGYTKNMMTPGPRAYCSKVEETKYATPDCSQGKNAVFNWEWSTAKGGCTHGNSTTVTTDNVKCDSGFAFNKTLKKCENKGGTFYSVPILK